MKGCVDVYLNDTKYRQKEAAERLALKAKISVSNADLYLNSQGNLSEIDRPPPQRKSLQQVLKDRHSSRAPFMAEASNPAGHGTF